MVKTPFYESKRFVTIVMIIAISLAIFAMFSTTNVGVAFLRTTANGIMP